MMGSDFEWHPRSLLQNALKTYKVRAFCPDLRHHSEFVLKVSKTQTKSLDFGNPTHPFTLPFTPASLMSRTSLRAVKDPS